MKTPLQNLKLMDLQTAANYIGLSESSIRRAIRMGKLPKLQPYPRAKIFFTKKILDDYLSGDSAALFNKLKISNIKKSSLMKCFEEFSNRLNRLEILISENFATPDKAADLDQLLTVEQAAEFLHLSIPTLYAKVCDRAIPHMKRSKRLYFDKKELILYLNDGRKVTATDCTKQN